MKKLLQLKYSGLIVCFIFSLIYLSIFYHGALFHSNKYLFYNEGDAIKNYYNYAWHIKNDKSFTQLNGTSYPFGENIFMEDSMPLLSNVLKVFSKIIPGTTQYSIGILNFLLLFSLAIGSVFVYLILAHFRVPPLLAAISGIAINFLSSQVLLINPAGHFGLAFTCFFPLGWYFIIQYFKKDSKLKWSIIIAINILIWTYIHIYLGYILILFTLLSHITKYFTSKKSKPDILPFLIQIILPIVFIFSLVHFTDHHPNRIDMPFSDDYAANFYSIFTPVISPLKPLYNLVFNLNVSDPLSWNNIGNYIGITSNLGIIIFFCIYIYHLMLRKKNLIINYIPQSIIIYLIPAIIILLYSMAIPFKYLPYKILELIPLIFQFSSYGRFAWVFYYVISVFSIILFYRLLWNSVFKKVIFFILLSFYFIEGSAYHTKESKAICESPNIFNMSYLPGNEKALASICRKNFQAILPLPYFFIYNLPFETAKSIQSINASFISSYYNALPVLSTYLSRPSIDESMAIYKQLMPAPYKINLRQLYNDGRDIAVIVNNDDTGYLNRNGSTILAKCRLIIRTEKYSIYRLPLCKLISEESPDLALSSNYIIHNFHLHKGCFVKDTSIFFIYESFDNVSSPILYRGKGAARGTKAVFNLILNLGTEKLDTSKYYDISFWYYNYLWDQTYNTAIISEKSRSGETLQDLTFDPLNADIIDGWWYLSEYRFKIKSNNSMLSFCLHGENNFKPWFVIDEFLLRPSNIDIYNLKSENGKIIVYKNNQRLSDRE